MTKILHHSIDIAAERHPERDAFRCGRQSITYQSLMQRTSQLAACLREHGVRKGDRVGVRLPPCIEAAVAVYGILKAGAVFVPIDPQLPTERLCRILQIGDIRHLVTLNLNAETQQAVAATYPALRYLVGSREQYTPQLRAISWTEVQQNRTLSESIETHTDDAAYVIFTSGSTGTPKGIVHTHYSGSNYARLSVATYNITGEDRIANFSPLHFDMSTLGYLSAPHAGATTILIPDAYLKLPASLTQLVEQESITIWYSVPFILIHAFQRGVLNQRDLSSLKWVLFGGEPFRPKHLYDLMKALPGTRFSNVYGPAEVNQCTYFHVPDTDSHPTTVDNTAPIPIGSVWDETEALIVDADDELVSDGQAGELLVHSSTMMVGYWDRSPSDSSVFFVSADGKRFYRTGDIVRRGDDGNLRFLGRKDRQIKIRGYRVELDDVEHALTSHPSIVEAAVFCTHNGDGEPQLSAVATLTASSATTTEELRKWLLGKLPSYSVPQQIEIRHSFPRTTSGKIDRGQLAIQSGRSD